MRIVILYFISFSLNALKKQSASTQYFNDLLRLISKRNWSCFFKASVSSSFLTKFHLADSRQNPVCRVYVSAEYCFYSFNKRSLFLLNILFCSSKLSHLVTSSLHSPFSITYSLTRWFANSLWHYWIFYFEVLNWVTSSLGHYIPHSLLPIP